VTAPAADPVNILLVDDRPSNLLSLRAILEAPDYNVVLAQSGEEALLHVLREDFAVILLDVAMPRLDGFATASLIKQRDRSKKIPIIFVTASVFDIDNIFRGYTVGAVDYLQKPVDAHALRAKVSVFVELFRQARQIERQAEQLRESERRERDLEKAQAEVALARSEAAYQATFDEAPIGIGHATPDRRWLRVNRRLCEIFGVSREQMLDGRFLDRAHPDDVAPLAAAFEDVISGSQPSRHAECRFVREGGHRLWLSVSLSLLRDAPADTRVIAIVEDVTARRQTEEALRASEARFRRLSESGLIGIAFWDGDGAITDANDAFLEMVGRSREELERRAFRIRDLTPEEFAPADARATEELRRTRICAVYEKELVRPDGRRVPVLAGGALLEGSDDAGVAFFLDVAERKRIELERARLVEELRDALQSRDDFLSIAAHELKTPLTPLRLQTRSILRALQKGGEAVPTAERTRRSIETIEQSVIRLERLIDNLLDLSQIRVGRLALEREELDLAAIVREAADRLRTAAEAAGSTIEVRADAPVLGRWDRLRLDQAISNILTNAIKYGAGRPIEIDVSGDDHRGRFTVADHGIGIEPGAQARIFDRFERLAPVRHFGGFGLGLWIVRKIVEAHGGQIQVWSRPNEGSRFTVDLPRTAPSQTLDPTKEPPQEPTADLHE